MRNGTMKRPSAMPGLALLVALLAPAGPLSAAAGPEEPSYRVEIRRTAFGIPHVKADDYGSLGYGVGYAYAEDNACLLAEAVLTVRGERSRHFGGDALSPSAVGPVTNLDSDLFYKFYLDSLDLAGAYRRQSPKIAALIDGYAAGYNRRLAEAGTADLPEPCRNAAWVTPITSGDVQRLLADKAIQASGHRFMAAITKARPPAERKAGDGPGDNAPLPGRADAGADAAPALGSNAYALGRDLAADGSGLLLANPHFPWQGINRFYELHLTIPGELDVMGAVLPPLPVVTIGFNRDVAWTHTVSTGRRFSLHALTLVPGNPLAYRYDGAVETMRPTSVSVTVKQPDGSVTSESRTFYESRFGPILAQPSLGLTWTAEHAFAFQDANRLNTRLAEQWLAINRARSAADVQQALETVLGVPWVNTIAADRGGDALYADISVVPNLSDATLERCSVPGPVGQAARQAQIPLLDGSRGACAWEVAAGTPEPGLMPVRSMPRLLRRDYVLNSNDSYWLANADAPLTGYPRIIGASGVPQNGRTRMGHRQLGELIAAKPGAIVPDDLKAMVLGNRNHSAELAGDDLARFCAERTPADAHLDRACAVLAGWDRRDGLESRGAAFHREFWRRALKIPGLWRTPFDPARALETPRDLDLGDGAARAAIGKAMTETVAQFQDLGLALDAPLGALQGRRTAAGTIPVPGGEEFEGVLNQISPGPLTRDGYAGLTLSGSSFILAVTWPGQGEEREPMADALLTYAQSSNPASPHHADQTALYAKGQWLRLPFSEAAITKDPAFSVKTLRR